VIRVFEDRQALAGAAAGLFAELACSAFARTGHFSVLLAGGETPRLTYQLLAGEPYRSTVPWHGIHFFWGDERCVPCTDPRSNQFMVRRALLDALPLPPENIHPIICNGSPEQAAAEYESELRSFFGDQPPHFDLALLGLGDDGHTASLLPGSAALHEKLCWTAVSARSDEEFSRITLTTAIINQAAVVLFLVSGSGKAAVLGNILGETVIVPPYPAQLIQPDSGDLRWFVDRESATKCCGFSFSEAT
jgi:6-phosphogluconolactonase